jgi:hypothetical protein
LATFWQFAKHLTIATGLTGVIGLTLMVLIERVMLRASPHTEIEQLFGNLYVMSAGLAAVGVMIIDRSALNRARQRSSSAQLRDLEGQPALVTFVTNAATFA